MIHKPLSILALVSLFAGSQASAQTYQYNVDLTRVTDDKLTVELTVPAIKGDTATYFIPKIVPGTYDVYDFGRFVHHFKALDGNGDTLPVWHPDFNTWKIAHPDKLVRIMYEVEDTWDTENEDGEFVFEPGGTNIEDGKNFVINGHGFFGYFDGMRELPYELTFTRPENFYGASAMNQVSAGINKDKFSAKNYFEVTDSPIMYCKPDTTSLEVGGAKVLFSLYSPSGEVNSEFVSKEVSEILEAQRQYLGGKLPVDRYAFIIYLFEGFFGGSGSYGALEHNQCSFYYLPEMQGMFLSETIRDFSAHEFFHIVTPLSIHSEEIHYFDYIDPEMSRHLWMYEGVTEYFAGHVQASYELETMEEYLETLQEKIMNAEGYREDISFTELSLGCLGEHKDQYMNVYQKGSLIGLCLDILLRRESKGEMGLRDLMGKLMQKFGPERPFKDEELFSEIENMTWPAIGEFLRRHVGGAEPLPLEDVFAVVGIKYARNFTYDTWSMGGVNVDVNDDDRIYVTETYEMDEFGRAIGYEEGDILMKFNGSDITAENAEDLFISYFESAEEGDTFTLEVMRLKKKNKYKKTTLSTPLQKVERSIEFFLQPDEEASDAAVRLRNQWLLE